jgi:septal ring factor EnvC (AmiA/AmiB activator)
MGEDGVDGLFKVLWRGKFYIVLAFALAITMAIAAYYILDSRDLSSRLGQTESDYNALNDKYDQLSYDHSALVASNEDLNRRYTGLDDKYNQLTVDDEELKSTYNDLNGKVNRMHETGGPSFALRYSFYEGGPSNNRKNYLEAWIYNVGDGREDRVTVKARMVNADNSTSVSEQTFNDVDALDKRYVKWEYSTAVHLESVWYET